MAIKTGVERVPARGPLDWAAVFLAAGFGSGYSPIAPGTAGTLVAVPIHMLLVWHFKIGLVAYASLCAVLTALGCLAAHRAGKHFGEIDSGKIVIDEVVGFLIAMTAAPPGWIGLIVGFLLFRVFDILKPWPAIYFDRKIANGFGVVMDDVTAGLYVAAIMQLLKFFQIV